MKSCKVLLAWVLVVAFILVANVAAAPTLTFKFTKVSVPGAIASAPGGINNSGVIVGQYEDKKTVLHFFMLVGSR